MVIAAPPPAGIFDDVGRWGDTPLSSKMRGIFQRHGHRRPRLYRVSTFSKQG